MEIKDTIQLMNSNDYKQRFIAEYVQVKIRYDKLDKLTVKYEAGTLDFTPKCSLELLKEQKKFMGNYIRTLKIRAEIENIDLPEV
uniref:crAss001_48 related protein n=1 Tax=Eubacterium sp. TaxID=142586 RepID=UPI0040268CEA